MVSKIYYSQTTTTAWPGAQPNSYPVQNASYAQPQQQQYIIPQQTYAQPQQTYTQPLQQQTYVQPQQQYIIPQQTYVQPQLTYAQPQQQTFITGSVGLNGQNGSDFITMLFSLLMGKINTTESNNKESDTESSENQELIETVKLLKSKGIFNEVDDGDGVLDNEELLEAQDLLDEKYDGKYNYSMDLIIENQEFLQKANAKDTKTGGISKSDLISFKTAAKDEDFDIDLYLEGLGKGAQAASDADDTNESTDNTTGDSSADNANKDTSTKNDSSNTVNTTPNPETVNNITREGSENGEKGGQSRADARGAFIEKIKAAYTEVFGTAPTDDQLYAYVDDNASVEDIKAKMVSDKTAAPAAETEKEAVNDLNTKFASYDTNSDKFLSAEDIDAAIKDGTITEENGNKIKSNLNALMFANDDEGCSKLKGLSQADLTNIDGRLANQNLDQISTDEQNKIIAKTEAAYNKALEKQRYNENLKIENEEIDKATKAGTGPRYYTPGVEQILTVEEQIAVDVRSKDGFDKFVTSAKEGLSKVKTAYDKHEDAKHRGLYEPHKKYNAYLSELEKQSISLVGFNSAFLNINNINIIS